MTRQAFLMEISCLLNNLQHLEEKKSDLLNCKAVCCEASFCMLKLHVLALKRVDDYMTLHQNLISSVSVFAFSGKKNHPDPVP